MGGAKIRAVSKVTRLMSLDRMISCSGQHSIVPFYHVVSDKQLPHIRHLYRYRNVSVFVKDIDNLLTIYKPLSLAEFIKSRDRGEKKNNMLLTFDDGLVECHQIIAPILKKKGVPAVFFLNNKFIDNKGLFYRYKVSILIEELHSSPGKLATLSKFLDVVEDKVISTLLGITYAHLALLDTLAEMFGLDFNEYLNEQPVYMSTHQLEEMLLWGFDIGGHSLDHPDYSLLSEEDMISQTQGSLEDLKTRFKGSSSAFAFPFSSEGIPDSVIDHLLNTNTASLLLGISGLKKSRNPGFIQRIDMEKFNLPAIDVLKIKYLRYLLRIPLGRHYYD